MAGELESCKPLSGLLNGLAQEAFHGHSGITEELLQSQLYPEVPLEEFRPFLAKMRGILKVPRPLQPPPGLLPPSLILVKRLSFSDLCSMSSTLRSFRIWALALSSLLIFLRGTAFCLSSQYPQQLTDTHQRGIWVFSQDTFPSLCR